MEKIIIPVITALIQIAIGFYYSTKLEPIKSSLALLNDKEKLIFTEEKEVLALFFTQLNTWLLFDLNFRCAQEYVESNKQEIDAKLDIIRDDASKTYIAFGRVELIVRDDKLIKAGEKAIIAIDEYKQFKKDLLTTLSKNLEMFKKDKHGLNTLQNYEEDKGYTIFHEATIQIDNFKNRAKEYLRKHNKS